MYEAPLAAGRWPLAAPRPSREERQAKNTTGRRRHRHDGQHRHPTIPVRTGSRAAAQKAFLSSRNFRSLSQPHGHSPRHIAALASHMGHGEPRRELTAHESADRRLCQQQCCLMRWPLPLQIDFPNRGKRTGRHRDFHTGTSIPPRACLGSLPLLPLLQSHRWL